MLADNLVGLDQAGLILSGLKGGKRKEIIAVQMVAMLDGFDERRRLGLVETFDAFGSNDNPLFVDFQ